MVIAEKKSITSNWFKEDISGALQNRKYERIVKNSCRILTEECNQLFPFQEAWYKTKQGDSSKYTYIHK